jgi:hypothetical protein
MLVDQADRSVAGQARVSVVGLFLVADSGSAGLAYAVAGQAGFPEQVRGKLERHFW